MAKKKGSKAGRNELKANQNNEKLNISFYKKISELAKGKLLVVSSEIKTKGLKTSEKLDLLKDKTKDLYQNVLKASKETYKTILEAAPVKELSKLKEISQSALTGKIIVKYTSVILVTALMVSLVINFRPVVVVSMKDKAIAVVPAKKDFDKILLSLQKNWRTSYNREVNLSEKPVFKVRILPKKLISTPREVASAIEANTDYLAKGYGIAVNGKLRAVVKDKSTAEEALNGIKKLFGSGKKDEVLEFAEKVEIVSAYAPQDRLLGVVEAISALTNKVDATKEYIVKDGDTLWDIAENNKLAVEKLFDLNSNINEDLKPGQVLKLAAPVAVLNVKSVQVAEVEESTPFETKFESDPNKFKGERKVLAQGSNGKKKLKIQLIKQNGVEIAKSILEESIISNPKTEVIAIGTKAVNERGGTGAFRVPAFGSLTSRFGYRWGRMHEGVDIAASIGTPIYAADGGTVVFSGVEDGYGNLIKIDHGNGYVTYYGHNSKNMVRVGQKVGKGQQIGLVGNTGRSTGAHVHFEVRRSGRPTDPLKYIR